LHLFLDQITGVEKTKWVESDRAGKSDTTHHGKQVIFKVC
jgi:hypothetical protein